jgi:hypothetical protein
VNTVVPDPARQRALRKQDLLLASQLARGQAMAAFDELGERADTLALRVARVRLWLSDPQLWLAGSAAGGLVLAIALRRTPARRWLRWGFRAWRVWRAWRMWGEWRRAQPLRSRAPAAL